MTFTLGLTMLIFVIIFSWALDPREKAQEMDNNRLIEGIEELNPAVIAVN